MTEHVDEAPVLKPRLAKAIPPARDHLQSRSLVLVVATAICACIIIGVLASGEEGGRYKVAGISLLFASVAVAMRSATIGGAICGALTCFCVTWWTRDLESPLLHSALLPLVALFLLTYVATRAGKGRKQQRGLAELTGGRTAAQVLANLGVAALIVTPVGAYAAAFAGLKLPIEAPVLAGAALAALAEATADTVSSEIGQAFGTQTFMLTTWRRVHRGTDGGVSARGSWTGLAAALIIVLVGGWSMHLPAKIQAAAFAAGLIGFVADSLLGATIERRGWIGNDLVNFTATAIASLTFLIIIRFTSIPA